MERQTIDQILTALPGATRRRWFGVDGFSVAGNIFATWWRDEIVLRLPQAERTAVLERGHAHPWNPRGRGKPMGDWVVIERPNRTLSRLATAAHGYALEKSRATPGKRKRER